MMEISCYYLTELSRDKDFAQLLRVYEKRQYDEKLASDVRDIFLNFRSFLAFLESERKLLLDAGLSEEAVDELLGQIMMVRLEAAGFKLDANSLLENLQRLAGQSCSASGNVSAAVKSSEKWCNATKYGMFALGAGATLVDGAAYLVPIGITQARAAASIAAGSVLMSAAGLWLNADGGKIRSHR